MAVGFGIIEKDETPQGQISSELYRAAQACEKIIAEAVREAFGDKKFPKTKFWVEHVNSTKQQSFEGLVIGPYASLQIRRYQSANEVPPLLNLYRDTECLVQAFVLLPDGLYVFDRQYGDEPREHLNYPVIGTGERVAPMVILLLTGKILDRIAEAVQEQEKKAAA